MTYDEIVAGLNSDVIKTKDCSLYNAWHGNGGGYCYSLQDAVAGLATSDILAEINFRDFDKAFVQALDSNDAKLKRIAYQNLAKISINNRYSVEKADWAGEFQLGIADRLMVLIENSKDCPELKVDALQTIMDIYKHSDYRFYSCKRWAEVLGENVPMLIEAEPESKKKEGLVFALRAYSNLFGQNLDTFKKNLLRWRTSGTNTERRGKAEIVSQIKGEKDDFWQTLGEVSFYSGSQLNKMVHRFELKKDGAYSDYEKTVADFRAVFATKSENSRANLQNSR